MDILVYALIALLVGQIYSAGIIKSVLGLVTWSVLWAVVALVHNLFADEVNAWSYFSFWQALFSTEGSVSDYIHLNIGTAIGNLLALSESNSAESSSDGGDHPVIDSSDQS
jgi:hypothetical protein